jgi:hypothetical protein
MATPQSNLYLFFSNYCPHSKKIMTRVGNSNLANSITFCCVDNKQLKIPPFIKSVPTLYIANQLRVLTDQGLLMWLDTELRGNQQQQQRPPMQHQQPQQPMIQQQQIPSNPANAMNGLAGNALLTGDNGISAYHSNEIGAGFSDNYSFIDNPSGGLTHSYTFIEGVDVQQNTGNGGLPQMGISSNADKQNEKEAMMNKAYEELLAQRKQEMPKPIGAMRM